MRRWVAGALVLPVAAALGAVVGFAASVFFMIALQNWDIRLRGRYPVGSLYVFFAPHYRIFVKLSAVIGAGCGVWIGCWLVGRLWCRSEKRR